MSTRATFIVSMALILLSLGAGVYYYNDLPAVMAGHWDATGTVNGTIGKFWGVTLMPLLMLIILCLLLLVPQIDPLRRNFQVFRSKYNVLITLLMLFFSGIQIAMLAVNLGAQFNIAIVIMPLIGILFFYIGTLLPNTRRNFFFGVRTPWTVTSDVVWSKTNRLGGILFKVLGVFAVLTVLAPAYALLAFVAPTVVVVIGLVIYSYATYREIEGQRATH